MASAYTITNITDVPATDTSSLLQAERGRTLPEDSRVEMYANREAVGVLLNGTIGPDSILSDAPLPINATVGDMPSLRDDKIYDGFGEAGQEIQLLARNSTAGALEARVVVRVTPVDDNALRKAMENLGLG